MVSKKSQREEVIQEIIETEKRYVDGLLFLTKAYIKPIQALSYGPGEHLMSMKDFHYIFDNILMILKVNQMLLAELTKPNVNVGQVFLKMAPFLKSYASYTNNYTELSNKMKKLIAENPKLQKYMNEIEKKTTKQGHVRFFAYMITPVQRIPRYTLLLKELLKHTDEKSPEYATLKQAYTTITQVAEHVNEKMKQDDKKKKLIEIRNHIQGWYGNDELIKPNRYWVMDGELWYRTKGKYRQRHVYLFNNMILIANMRKYCKHFTLEETPIPWVNIKHHNNAKDKKDTHFEIITQTKIHQFRATSPESREEWVKVITATIEALRENTSFKERAVSMRRQSTLSIELSPRSDLEEEMPFIEVIWSDQQVVVAVANYKDDRIWFSAGDTLFVKRIKGGQYLAIPADKSKRAKIDSASKISSTLFRAMTVDEKLESPYISQSEKLLLQRRRKKKRGLAIIHNANDEKDVIKGASLSFIPRPEDLNKAIANMKKDKAQLPPINTMHTTMTSMGLNIANAAQSPKRRIHQRPQTPDWNAINIDLTTIAAEQEKIKEPVSKRSFTELTDRETNGSSDKKSSVENKTPVEQEKPSTPEKQMKESDDKPVVEKTEKVQQQNDTKPKQATDVQQSPKKKETTQESHKQETESPKQEKLKEKETPKQETPKEKETPIKTQKETPATTQDSSTLEKQSLKQEPTPTPKPTEEKKPIQQPVKQSTPKGTKLETPKGDTPQEKTPQQTTPVKYEPTTPVLKIKTPTTPSTPTTPVDSPRSEENTPLPETRPRTLSRIREALQSYRPETPVSLDVKKVSPFDLPQRSLSSRNPNERRKSFLAAAVFNSARNAHSYKPPQNELALVFQKLRERSVDVDQLVQKHKEERMQPTKQVDLRGILKKTSFERPQEKRTQQVPAWLVALREKKRAKQVGH